MGSSINLALDCEASATSTPVSGRPSTSTLYSQFQSTESENRSVPSMPACVRICNTSQQPTLLECPCTVKRLLSLCFDLLPPGVLKASCLRKGRC